MPGADAAAVAMSAAGARYYWYCLTHKGICGVATGYGLPVKMVRRPLDLRVGVGLVACDRIGFQAWDVVIEGETLRAGWGAGLAGGCRRRRWARLPLEDHAEATGAGAGWERRPGWPRGFSQRKGGTGWSSR